MQLRKTKGMIVTPMIMVMDDITIRAEGTRRKGKDFITVSLADDKRGVMLQVNYDDIKALVDNLAIMTS